MLSKEVEQAIQQALEEARHLRHEYATAEHLCLALLDTKELQLLLDRFSVDRKTIQTNFNLCLSAMEQVPIEEDWDLLPSLGFQRVLERAAVHVMGAGKKEVLPSHVLVSILSEEESLAASILEEHGLSRLEVVLYLSHGDADTVEQSTPDTEEVLIGSKVSQPRPKEVLDLFAVNLNERAKKGELEQLIGRKEELQRLIHILLRRKKNNPLLVGEAGVGKTAIMEGLAQRIVQGQVPEALQSAEVYLLDMGHLIAGTRFRGDFEDRLKKVFVALEQKPCPIVAIDEVHTVIGAGSTSGGSMDASNLLKPILTSGKIRLIGSTTYKEYRTHIEKDRALVRRFQKMDIQEPSQADCLSILEGLKTKYEEFHHVEISKEALEACVSLSIRYLQEKCLPDKAIDLLDEAGAALHLQKPLNVEKPTLTKQHIEEAVSQMAHIPKETVGVDDREALKQLETDLRRVVFGQDQAIEKLVTAVQMSRAGLRSMDKTIGNFLFTGPTGVGKTETAKQLAKTLGIGFVRLDMSEYMERHSVSRLVGAPPGYVGFEQGGILTDLIHQNPYSVLLLDEIEKAHPDIFHILLQIMDYGRLTDSNGRATDFRHAIIIMTSNVGARELANARIGFGDTTNIKGDEEAFRRVFSPEFRNRLDARIAFLPLDHQAMGQIVCKAFAELQEQVAKRGMEIQVTEPLRAYLATKGYDKTMGARPLLRLMDEEVKKPLAKWLLFENLQEGGRLVLDYRYGQVHLEKC